MSDEKSDPARRHKSYLQEWIARDNKQQTLRPQVERMLSTATWTVEAMDELRSTLPSMATEVDQDLMAAVKVIERYMPLPVEYDDTTTLTSTVSSVAANTRVYDALLSAQGVPGSTPGLELFVKRYEGLQAEQGREHDAATRVASLFPALASRFNDAANAAHIARGDPSSRERAAFAMRTFIDKLKGELLDKARKHERESISWAVMAERLAPPPNRAVLAAREDVHSRLIDMLSRIGKARGTADFEQAWTLFLDQVYVVCGAVLAGVLAGRKSL
jgi:hypothetical protein